MDSHLLFELTYVLYRICPTIIHGERWLMETPRQFCLFYPPCKGWFRNLAQDFLQNVSSYFFARRSPTFPFIKILFLTRERLLGGVLDRCLYIVSSSSLEETSKLEGDRFCFARRNCFFKSSISRYMAFSSSCLWAAWPFLRKPLPPVWTVCGLPSW